MATINSADNPPNEASEIPQSQQGLSYEDVRAVLQQSAEAKRTVVPLNSQRRLQALDDLDILDQPSRRSFQVLVDLANKLLDTPVSLISLVTNERQFFLSSSGLDEPWAGCRETPLSHSFCQHVVKRNEPLVVSDAKHHGLVKDNLAIEDLGVRAYLGVPVVLPDGNVIGSFCAIDSQPRSWTQEDLETIETLVDLTIVELSVKQEARKKQEVLENRLLQAQKMQAIGQLVGGVAHDFNNVLSAIQVQADLLEAQLKDQSPPPIGNIRESVRSAKTIVQQLLNWSRPSLGTKTPSSLTQIVTDSLPLISTYSTKFIDVEFAPQPCADMIMADSNKISQVLLNLCSNSAYAMKSKGSRIEIEVSADEVDRERAEQLQLKAGPHVKLRVEDDGCGIPKEHMLRIHDPYFTTKPIGEGTGLGLWTVYGIVQEHNGHVHVDSHENAGTTIEIYFPLTNAVSEPSASKEIEKATEKKADIRMLLVDDEPNITNGLESLFNLAGYKARGFTNGLKALKVFAEDPNAFDIIITDQVMPDISGEELIREFKAIRPEIPVILCSGYSEDFQRNDSETLLADAYCEKPNRFEELVQLIDNLVG